MSDRHRDSYAGKSRSGMDRNRSGRYDQPRSHGAPRGDPYEFEGRSPMDRPVDRPLGYDRMDSGRFGRDVSPRPLYPREDYPQDRRGGRRDDRYEGGAYPPRDYQDRGYTDREPPRSFVDHRHRDYPPEPFRDGRDSRGMRDGIPPRDPYPPRRDGRPEPFERKRGRSRSRSREQRFPDAKREPFSRDQPQPRENSEIVENSIFISNLPTDVNVSELASLFGSIGVIQVDKRTGLFKIKLYYNTDGSCKGEASIYYADTQAARAAIQWFNHSDLRGKKMTVQMTDRSYSTTRPQQKGGNYRGGPRGSGDNADRGKGGSGNKPSFIQPGDWTCTSCKNTNFSWRTSCNRCQAEKPPGVGETEERGYQGGYKRSPPRGNNPRGSQQKGRPYV